LDRLWGIDSGGYSWILFDIRGNKPLAKYGGNKVEILPTAEILKIDSGGY
jgi:hypothetical protein